RNHVPFLLWSESNEQDLRRGFAVVENFKSKFLRRCDGFVVPGSSARAYLRGHNVSEARIFTAPNAVDNDLFASAAATTRGNAPGFRSHLALPGRYMLFVGRLVPDKGIFDLLTAYAKLDAPIRQQVGLVFVGDGASGDELRKQAQAISPGTVKFAGF